MEQILIITLSSSIFISLILISWLFKENRRLFKENDSLKKSSDKVRKYTDDLLSIKVGDRAILPNYELVYDKTDSYKTDSFHVNYEVEIIEISTSKVKVKAIDFQSNDTIGRDPKNKSRIIAFMQNKWVDKSDLELVVDDRMRRDRKLRDLGILD